MYTVKNNIVHRLILNFELTKFLLAVTVQNFSYKMIEIAILTFEQTI